MQILPGNRLLHRRTSPAARASPPSDLATPSINVAYGSYYLRYLLDHYDGNEMLAVAAYNGGLANVDRWVAHARAEGGHADASTTIPFPETRAYVQRVLARAAGLPRRPTAGAELGARG